MNTKSIFEKEDAHYWTIGYQLSIVFKMLKFWKYCESLIFIIYIYQVYILTLFSIIVHYKTKCTSLEEIVKCVYMYIKWYEHMDQS